jgi:hypothetical protein
MMIRKDSLIILAIISLSFVGLIRSQVLTGGTTEHEEMSDIMKDAFDKGLRLWNQQNTNLQHYYGHPTVQKIHSQVVEGIKYTFDVTLKKTNCLKTQLNLLQVSEEDLKARCQPTDGEIHCAISVWLRPWLEGSERLKLVQPSNLQSQQCSLPFYSTFQEN